MAHSHQAGILGNKLLCNAFLLPSSLSFPTPWDSDAMSPNYPIHLGVDDFGAKCNVQGNSQNLMNSSKQEFKFNK